MNFQVLARFVVVLGVAFLAYAGYQYATNQPLEFDSANSGPGVFGGRDDFSNLLNVQGENLARDYRRRRAAKPAVTGGIILFAALALIASTKPTPSPASASRAAADSGPDHRPLSEMNLMTKSEALARAQSAWGPDADVRQDEFRKQLVGVAEMDKNGTKVFVLKGSGNTWSEAFRDAGLS